MGFDGFEQALRSELSGALPALYESQAGRFAAGTREGGGAMVAVSDLPKVLEGVMADAVLLALRRYHEWAG